MFVSQSAAARAVMLCAISDLLPSRLSFSETQQLFSHATEELHALSSGFIEALKAGEGTTQVCEMSSYICEKVSFD